MKKCEKCGYNFKIEDGLKSYFKNVIECPNCNSNFKKQTRWIYSALIIAIGVQIYLNVVPKITLLNISVYLFISLLIEIVFEIIPHKLHSYKEIK